MKNDIHVDVGEFLHGLKPREGVAVICGNGPSLRGFDFKRELNGYDVFGMNAAYRHWDRIGWYPTYYSCLDRVVGMSHLHEIARLIERREEYGIRSFFLTMNVVRALGTLGTLPCVLNCDTWMIKYRKVFFYAPHFNIFALYGSTGSLSLRLAAFLGYKNCILLGIDGYVVEILPESNLANSVLTVVDTPKHNPNYFFDDYQQQGDKYNIPSGRYPGNGIIPLDTWEAITGSLRMLDVVVVNANPQSQVEAFSKCSFAYAPAKIVEIRERMDALRNDAGFVGLHSREENLCFNEIEVFYPFLPQKGGCMLDVGALNGSTCIHFLSNKYEVHAFEPDPGNRAMLKKLEARYKNLNIDDRAVCEISGEQRAWFGTPESYGASSLSSFTNKHIQTATVTTVTLSDYCSELNITHVDFLKIDTEGYDLMVLKGFPFERVRPTCILCEFEDRKTLPLGYSVYDMANFLQERGYYILVSEWHPILRYGIQHQWRRIVSWPSECDPLAWGNLLAFESQPDMALLRQIISAIPNRGGGGLSEKAAGLRKKLNQAALPQ